MLKVQIILLSELGTLWLPYLNLTFFCSLAVIGNFGTGTKKIEHLFVCSKKGFTVIPWSACTRRGYISRSLVVICLGVGSLFRVSESVVMGGTSNVGVKEKSGKRARDITHFHLAPDLIFALSSQSS